MPLLITHGWPGSVVEFHKVIEPLTDPTRFGGSAADAFHVVCPSLPGFGFSGKPKTSGWGVQRIAQAWTALMARLGYPRYGAQGGDWGSAVTANLGALDPSHCACIHITLAMGARPRVEGEPTAEEQRALKGLEALPPLGFRLFDATSNPPPDLGLQPDRLARRTSGMDFRKVLGLDRLRWPSREHPQPRRTAGQRHAVLGDGIGNFLGKTLLGKLREGRRGTHRRCANGCGSVSQGDRHSRTEMDGAALQEHYPLERNAKGRPLRRLRAAGTLCG